MPPVGTAAKAATDGKSSYSPVVAPSARPPGPAGKRKRLRRILFGAVLVCFGLPIAAVLGAAAIVACFDRSDGTMVSSGEEREYLLHVPSSYDGGRPAPLVISFHGGATWPAQQANLSGWNRLADEHGFFVVYPAGDPELPILGIPRIWPVERAAELAKDVRFVDDLIDRLEARYAIDPERIYANGMSQGGAMAFAVSCALPERIAAVGTVAAAHALPFEACADSRPVPLIAFHGSADPIVPIDGGRLGDPFNPVKPVYPSVRSFTASWARRNGCEPSPVVSRFSPEVDRVEYAECAEDAAVVLYVVRGAGHVWPGGKPLPKWRVGPPSDRIHATSTTWDFFRSHPRRQPRPGPAADPDPDATRP